MRRKHFALADGSLHEAPVVSKLEAGGDIKLSTLQRYCAAIGQKLALTL
jgi:hypothetical protein